MVHIIALANQKGGVGKTTTAVNLATALAAIGKKTLLVDLDPQGNASTGLGIPLNKRAPGVYDLLVKDFSMHACIKKTAVPALSIIPSSPDLAGAEIELVNISEREKCLFKKLQNLDYEYVFIDCPPALGLLTLNALNVAKEVLVPLQCEYYALEGLSQLLKTIEVVSKKMNPLLKLKGIVLTMFDSRNSLSSSVEKDVRSCMKEKVYETVIPRNVRVSEAPSHGLPAMLYDHRSSGAKAYMQLASEILKQDKREEK